MNDITERNVEKVTQFREGGKEAFDKFVNTVGKMRLGNTIKREDVPFDGENKEGEEDGKRRRERRWGGFI